MKFLFILFIHLLASYSYAQSYETKYKVVSIQENQRIQLDSRSKIGGKDRNHIKFSLPPNTVKWYYIFGTYTPEERAPTMELAIELGHFVGNFVKEAKIATTIIDKLTEPNGNSAIDVYLTNTTGHHQFFEENLTGWAYIAPSYLKDGTKENFMSGKIAINTIYSGDLYLNFKNPKMIGGITVNVSIAAIVAEKVYVDKWTTESINHMHESCLSDFANVDSKVQSVCNCITEKLTERYKPKYFTELSSDRQQQVFNIVKEECYQSTGHTDIANKDARIKELSKEIQGLTVTKDYKLLVDKYDELISLGLTNSNIYNGAGWNCLLTKQFERAKEYIIKGLGENRNDVYLHGNLANYYMFKGEFEKAKEIHLKFKKHKFDKKRAWKDAVAEDLNLFESLDIYHNDFNNIRKVLGIPRGRFAETFDPRYETNGTMSFEKGKESFVGVITELDKDKGSVKIDYLNIYGEGNLITKKVTDIIPLTATEYEQKLANWKLEIQKYKYTVGQYATWLQQKELKFGTITKLNDKPHKASIEYLDIYGEKKIKEVPYLEVTIIDTNDYQTKLDAWNVEVSKYKFSVGEMVSWSGKGGAMVEGEVVGLDDKTHQAEVKYTNEKGDEKVIKKGYLKLVKK